MSTILLVEDNPHIMKINAEALTMYGYEILQAATARECRQALRWHPGGSGGAGHYAARRRRCGAVPGAEGAVPRPHFVSQRPGREPGRGGGPAGRRRRLPGQALRPGGAGRADRGTAAAGAGQEPLYQLRQPAVGCFPPAAATWGTRTCS